MVRLQVTSTGTKVLIDGQDFGRICEDRGFYVNPPDVRTFMRISPEDLREIATLAEEAMRKKRVGKAVAEAARNGDIRAVIG